MTRQGMDHPPHLPLISFPKYELFLGIGVAICRSRGITLAREIVLLVDMERFFDVVQERFRLRNGRGSRGDEEIAKCMDQGTDRICWKDIPVDFYLLVMMIRYFYLDKHRFLYFSVLY